MNREGTCSAKNVSRGKYLGGGEVKMTFRTTTDLPMNILKTSKS